MSQGKYCVAGLDLDTDRMVRPLAMNGDNWRLGTDRSVFSVGHVLECQPANKRSAVMPHATEDTPIHPVPVVMQRLREDETYGLVINSAADSVVAGIGHQLPDDKYIIEGSQCRSLTGVRAEKRRISFHESLGRLRLFLTDPDRTDYDLAVTSDVLQHYFSASDGDAEPHFGVDEANEWLAVNGPKDVLILRLGLARPWDGRDKGWNPRRCYLQLNGIICPQDNYHIFEERPST